MPNNTRNEFEVAARDPLNDRGDNRPTVDNGDATWNRRHPSCAVCRTACCLAKGWGAGCVCHACEAGIVRGREFLHEGRCLVIWCKARAVETVAALTEDIAAGLRVLRDRDHLPVSEEQVRERARNLVAAIVGNYDVQLIDRQPIDFATAVIS